MASLTEYKKKRKFDKTPEPGPEKKRTRTGRMFVIQKHRATQLHYDFRLEVDGVIPEGEYGGGTVMVWDYGTYKPEETKDVDAALSKGELKFTLDGEKLKGSWVLVRTRGRGERQWLLIK